MGRPPCCDKVGIKKGPWTPEEDIILVSYIQEHGPGNWRSVPTNTGKCIYIYIYIDPAILHVFFFPFFLFQDGLEDFYRYNSIRGSVNYEISYVLFVNLCVNFGNFICTKG